MDQQDRSAPIARARELGDTIAAAADEIERTRRIPQALRQRLYETRLLRLLLPRSVGGDEADPASYLAAIEELARHDGSLAWNVFVANSAALIAPFLAPDIAQTIFGPADSVMAWAALVNNPEAKVIVSVPRSAVAAVMAPRRVVSWKGSATVPACPAVVSVPAPSAVLVTM